jgi:hypothetical protein
MQNKETEDRELTALTQRRPAPAHLAGEDALRGGRLLLQRVDQNVEALLHGGALLHHRHAHHLADKLSIKYCALLRHRHPQADKLSIKFCALH